MTWRALLFATGNAIAIALLVLVVFADMTTTAAVALAGASGLATAVVLLRLVPSASFRSLLTVALRAFLVHALCSGVLSYLVAPRLLLGHSFRLPPGIKGTLLYVVLVTAHTLVKAFHAPLLLVGEARDVFHWYPAPWPVLLLNSLLASSCLAALWLWFRRRHPPAA